MDCNEQVDGGGGSSDGGSGNMAVAGDSGSSNLPTSPQAHPTTPQAPRAALESHGQPDATAAVSVASSGHQSDPYAACPEAFTANTPCKAGATF